MQIKDALAQGKPVFSFEFFPPRTDEGRARLWESLAELRTLEPTFVSVTYGAGGSTLVQTVDIVSRIRDELGLTAMSHLTCLGGTRLELGRILEELAERKVENVLALRGDPPQGTETFEPPAGGFRYANELVGFIRGGRWPFCVGAACYPEKHVEAASADADLDALKRKVDAGVDFLITQLFFDNRVYFDFVDRARAAGIHVPIIPGLMPITNVEQIERFTKLCGATIPPKLLEVLDRRRRRAGAVLELGVAHTTIQALGLLQGGAPGIHFYTLNKSTATREILMAIRTSARL